MIKPKGIMDFIKKDPSLLEKITYEEFMERCTKTGGIDDSGIEEAYEAYKRVMKELGEEV